MTNEAYVSLTACDLVGGSSASLVTATVETTRFIVFNRPEARNALSREMRRVFARLLQEAGSDEAISSVVITGNGGVFCAGSDIRESRADPGYPLVRPNPGEALRAVAKPVIAAVDGPCVTGGLEIALSCDFIIASDRARFADTHAKVGIFPAWGQTALLPRAVGIRRARQMSWTGAFIDARTAHGWGLVNEVVKPESLLPRCQELARLMAAADARSVQWQSRLMDEHDGAPLQDALAAEEAAVERWRSGAAHLE